MAVAAELPFRNPPSDLIELTTSALRGMVDSLGDPFAHVLVSHDASGHALPEWSPELFDPDAKTSGLSLRWEGNAACAEFVLQRSAAERAGLMAGDRLLAIDGQFLAQMSRDEVEHRLARSARLTLLRDGWSRAHDVTLVPEALDPRENAAAFLLPGGIGYLALRSFETGCASLLDQALRDLETRGLHALILDLRNDPGGSLAECEWIADTFLPAGQSIAILKGAGGSERKLVATATDRVRDCPLAILVNRCSASASEMLAGSLQACGRAKLVGEPTFGKGVGQSPQLVPGFACDTAIGETRSQYLLYFTVVRYELSDGRSVQGLGLQPDVQVAPSHGSGPIDEERLRLRDDPRVASFAAQLLDQKELAVSLAVEGLAPERVPGLADLAPAVRTFLPQDELVLVVRSLVRDRLETTMAALPDYLEDRQLQEAIRVVAREARLGDCELQAYRTVAALKDLLGR
jgi:carboxyl-terminal processing protease